MGGEAGPVTWKGHPIKLHYRPYKAFSETGSEKPSSRELLRYVTTLENRPHSLTTKVQVRGQSVTFAFKGHPL